MPDVDPASCVADGARLVGALATGLGLAVPPAEVAGAAVGAVGDAAVATAGAGAAGAGAGAGAVAATAGDAGVPTALDPFAPGSPTPFVPPNPVASAMPPKVIAGVPVGLSEALPGPPPRAMLCASEARPEGAPWGGPVKPLKAELRAATWLWPMPRTPIPLSDETETGVVAVWTPLKTPGGTPICEARPIKP